MGRMEQVEWKARKQMRQGEQVRGKENRDGTNRGGAMLVVTDFFNGVLGVSVLWNSGDQLDSKSNLVLLSLQWRKSIWVYRQELSRVSLAWGKHGIMNTRRAHRMGRLWQEALILLQERRQQDADSVTGGADRRRLIHGGADPCRRRQFSSEGALKRVPAEAKCQTILSCRFRPKGGSLQRPCANLF